MTFKKRKRPSAKMGRPPKFKQSRNKPTTAPVQVKCARRLARPRLEAVR